MNNMEGTVWKFLTSLFLGTSLTWFYYMELQSLPYGDIPISHMAHFCVPCNWSCRLRILSRFWLLKGSRSFRRSHHLWRWYIPVCHSCSMGRPLCFVKLPVVFCQHARTTVQKKQKQKYICFQNCKLWNVWISAIKINSVKTIEKSTFSHSICTANGSSVGFGSAAAVGFQSKILPIKTRIVYECGSTFGLFKLSSISKRTG